MTWKENLRLLLMLLLAAAGAVCAAALLAVALLGLVILNSIESSPSSLWTLEHFLNIFQVTALASSVAWVWFLVNTMAQNPQSWITKASVVLFVPAAIIALAAAVGGALGALRGMWLFSREIYHESRGVFLLGCLSVAYVVSYWLSQTNRRG